MTTLSGPSVYSSPLSARICFALPGAAHGEIALDLVGIEDVQRPAAVEGQVIGDIDQRIDRTKTDGDQPLLQPFRAVTILDAPERAPGETRAKMRIVAKIERDLDRRRALDL